MRAKTHWILNGDEMKRLGGRSKFDEMKPSEK